MHITLTGNLGSGKSTICKLLEAEYGYEIFSTGKVIREIANDLGISVLEMNELMCKDHKYDKMIDNKTASISKENPDKSILFDSRLAWNFVDKSFKVFLSVDLDEAARRVFSDSARGEVEKYTCVEQAKEKLAARAKNEDERYEEIYHIHYFDFKNYNLVLDSSYEKPELLSEVLIYEAGLCKTAKDLEQTGKFLISPKRLGFEKKEAAKKLPGYYPAEEIMLKAENEGLTIVSGTEIVERAAEEGYPFVAARLI